MKTKQMKVLYASRSSSKQYIGGNTYTCTPKISMEGKWLEELGFHIGDAIQIFYEDNCIRIAPVMVCEEQAQYEAEPDKCKKKR